MFTPKKSRALAPSCRERTGADVGSVQARQVSEGTQRHMGQSRRHMGQKHSSAHTTDSNVPASQGLGAALSRLNFTPFQFYMFFIDHVFT